MLSAIKYLFDYFLPLTCYNCSNIVSSKGLCSNCHNSIKFVSTPSCAVCNLPFEIKLPDHTICLKCHQHPPVYDKLRYLCVYDVNSKELIHNLKYNDKIEIASYIAGLWKVRFNNELQHYDYIIPVPMHFLKKLYRFYNQAEALALELSALTGIPIAQNLEKSTWTKPQSTLLGKERLNNLKGSFSIQCPSILEGKSVILVDDVHTTGTTLNTCTKLLKSAGVKNVMALCIAAVVRT